MLGHANFLRDFFNRFRFSACTYKFCKPNWTFRRFSKEMPRWNRAPAFIYYLWNCIWIIDYILSAYCDQMSGTNIYAVYISYDKLGLPMLSDCGYSRKRIFCHNKINTFEQTQTIWFITSWVNLICKINNFINLTYYVTVYTNKHFKV